MDCNINIDSKPFNFSVKGDFFWGDDEILFAKEKLAKLKLPWGEKGYLVAPLFLDDDIIKLKNGLKSILFNLLKEAGVNLTEDEFNPEEYHKWVKTEEVHQHVISKTRHLTEDDFAIDMKKLCERTSKIMEVPLASFIPELNGSHIILRVNRPNSLDINPPHRDGYLDVWKNIINLWVPLWGCNEKSSLPVIPGSQYWNENDIFRTDSQGAEINGFKYNVPAILKTSKGLNMIRPIVKVGEALVFTPFIIHGAAFNCNDDKTRISLEFRLVFKG